MTTDTEAIDRARHLGSEHGSNAAEWVGDGNTEDMAGFLCNLVRGIEEGDPEVMDLLPWPDLSGEWADGMTWYHLATECDANPDDQDLMMELCDSYEEGFQEGRDRRIYAMYLYYTEKEM